MTAVAQEAAASTPDPGRRWGELGIAGVLVISLTVLAALYLISAPLIMLLTTAFRGPQDLLPFEPGAIWTFENLRAVYLDTKLYTSVIPNTLIFTAGSVSLTFVLAFTLAWLVERTDLPWRTTVFTIVLFPLLVPGVVLAIAWIFLLSPNTGWVNVALRGVLGLTGSGPLDIFSMGGMILAQGVGLVPFVFLLLSAALRSMNPSLEEASSASGASPLVTFLRVTLPVLRPGILAPLILATLVTLEQFEIPLVIGFPARINVFSTRIYFELNTDSDLPAYGKAAAVALPFLVGGILLLLLYNRAIRRAEHFVTVTGKGYRPSRFALGRWKLPAILFIVIYLAIAAVLPAVVLVWASLFGYGVPSWPTLGTASFAAYAGLFASGKFWGAVGNTFLVAGSSAAIVTVIGALLAWTILRTRLPGRFVLDFVSFMSLGIPSVIAGLAAMLLYLSLPIGLYGTVWVLVLAYSYRMAVASRLGRAALMQIHAELEEASYTAGGGWATTIRRIVLPLLAPSLVASFVLLFILGFREFTLPTILQSPDNTVLSVIMWQLFQSNQTAQAAAVGTMIVLFVVPVIFAMRRLLLAQDGKD
ncbi:MAG: Iron(III) transport system permease protein [Rhodospirillales bacterium]|nr:Iron(III) transport system permease protein [Rhodospirillales bacterium]